MCELRKLSFIIRENGSVHGSMSTDCVQYTIHNLDTIIKLCLSATGITCIKRLNVYDVISCSWLLYAIKTSSFNMIFLITFYSIQPQPTEWR